MGSQKTRMSIEIIQKLHRQKPDAHVVVVVDGVEAQGKTWPGEVEKWSTMSLNITYVTYTSAFKYYSDKPIDLIVFDEVHCITPKSYKILKNNQIKMILGLSGTLYSGNAARMELINKMFQSNIVTLTLKQAVEDGIVNRFRIHAVPLELTQDEYDNYLRICYRVTRYGTDAAIGARTRFLHNHAIRTEFMIRYCLLYRDERFMVFTNSVNQCDLLPIQSFHSKSEVDRLTDFLEGLIQSISVVDKVNTGLNAHNLKHGLIGVANAEPVKFTQRLGRFLRLLDRTDTAEVTVPYFKDTQEVSWMDKSLRYTEGPYVKWDSSGEYFKNIKEFTR